MYTARYIECLESFIEPVTEYIQSVIQSGYSEVCARGSGAQGIKRWVLLRYTYVMYIYI